MLDSLRQKCNSNLIFFLNGDTSKQSTIVYFVGKGVGRRMIQHFYKTSLNQFTSLENPEKIERFKEIFSKGRPIYGLKVYSGLKEADAILRESLIIQCEDFTNILNESSGPN